MSEERPGIETPDVTPEMVTPALTISTAGGFQ
jgi:hypothetical protein